MGNTVKQEFTGLEKFSPIGRRLLQAFGTDDKAVIAEKLGFTSFQAVYKVLNGERELTFEKLIRFGESTGCSINWLLTGKGKPFGDAPQINDKILDRLRTIAHEQAHVVFADAELAGGNLDERTLKFLIDYLLYRSLTDLGLIGMSDVLSAADLQRAEKFSFLKDVPPSLEESVRGIIRETVESEVEKRMEAIARSQKKPVYEIDLTEKKKTRKAG